MKDGLLVQVGTPEEIVLSPATKYVEEFVKEAPRTKIIKVSQLMESVENSAQEKNGGEALNLDMTLEDALSWSAQRGGELPVKDAQGNTVGIITPETLATALSGGKRDN